MPNASKGSEIKRKQKFMLRLSTGDLIVCRRVDMVKLFMSNAIPTPMLAAAVGEFNNATKIWESGDVVSALNSLTKEQKALLSHVCHKLTVASCVEPQATLSKRESIAHDDLLWVGGSSDVPGDDPNVDEEGDISLTDQLSLFGIIMGKGGANVMPYQDAVAFRPRESGSTPAPVLDGQDVRTETVVMDQDDSRTHGTIEIVGKSW